MHTKDMGDLGEASVVKEALRRGHKVSLPLGENCRYDLVLDRGGVLERVQVKTVRSDGKVVRVPCRSVNSKLSSRYTDKDIEWLAVYDVTTDQCFFIPAAMLGPGGRASIWLRLEPTANGQERNVLWASKFREW